MYRSPIGWPTPLITTFRGVRPVHNTALFSWAKFMNQLVNPAVTTMSSQEIADLVESRHDKVKQSIERLYARRIIQLPPMGKVKNHLGQTVAVYLVGKRDSYIVVAQLSPEFTARLVDRWQELEAAAKPQIPQTFPEALRLAAQLAEENQKLTQQAALAAPKVDFADRVEKSSGVLIGEFAKAVGTGERRLFSWLRANGYLISTAGRRHNTPYQEYVDRGYFDVTERPFETPSGEMKASFTTHITGKGQLAITKKLKECGMIGEVAK